MTLMWPLKPDLGQCGLLAVLPCCPGFKDYATVPHHLVPVVKLLLVAHRFSPIIILLCTSLLVYSF